MKYQKRLAVYSTRLLAKIVIFDMFYLVYKQFWLRIVSKLFYFSSCCDSGILFVKYRNLYAPSPIVCVWGGGGGAHTIVSMLWTICIIACVTLCIMSNTITRKGALKNCEIYLINYSVTCPTLQSGTDCSCSHV